MYNAKPYVDNREYCDAPTAAMDPYTVQITNHLSETEKYLADILNRVHRLNDKLFGPSPMLAKSEPMFNNANAPVPKAMMEQIVGQTNIINRRLNELSEALNRLETL